ncbi:E3 ubiquitin-protein ligase hrd1 [Coemansia sp. Benny D160-2]|nr:E3 ubiquitin-protein ligase hrd1 [Coemansia sp. Benny D160-2]
MANANRWSPPRLVVYGITTVVLNIGIIALAFINHDYYYTACIQLSQSGAAMMILANMGILMTILLGKLFSRIFFGRLRAIEIERLYEQGWFAVTETCLALAILRDEFDAATLALFVFLLFCKVFHWIYEERVSFMEQQTGLTALFLVRTVSLSFILASVDFIMVMYAIENTKRYGPTMLVVFGFEFALLLVRFMSTWAKLILNTVDILRGGEWEEKQAYVFYVDFVDDLAKLVVYVRFFFVLMKFYGMPIHILRELYITARSLINRCGDWIRYRKAMQNMHLQTTKLSNLSPQRS